MDWQKERPLSDEEQELIINNQRLIWSRVHVHKFNSTRVTLNDMFQEGVFGMIKALRSFDPSKGATLSTHMYYGIDGAVRNSHRRRKGENLVSQDATSHDDADENLSIKNSLAMSEQDEGIESKVDYRTKILPLMEKLLTPEELIVIKCRYELDNYHPKNQDHIIKILNDQIGYDCTVPNLKFIRIRAVQKIREALGVDTDVMPD